MGKKVSCSPTRFTLRGFISFFFFLSFLSSFFFKEGLFLTLLSFDSILWSFLRMEWTTWFMSLRKNWYVEFSPCLQGKESQDDSSKDFLLLNSMLENVQGGSHLIRSERLMRAQLKWMRLLASGFSIEWPYCWHVSEFRSLILALTIMKIMFWIPLPLFVSYQPQHILLEI